MLLVCNDYITLGIFYFIIRSPLFNYVRTRVLEYNLDLITLIFFILFLQEVVICYVCLNK